ncbi:hypothetical protein KAT42_05220, partial [Candidatus Bathyarchaeota archaeon]|nr:hypothetical protein [Candidatus Bathyarchaeota archaeon]
DRCGSYLRETAEGLWCQKCRKIILSKRNAETRTGKKRDSSAVIVIERPKDHYSTISLKCPKCKNEEAYHWFSNVSGEHAGIRRERTIEHFKCTKCSYSWSRSS